MILEDGIGRAELLLAGLLILGCGMAPAVQADNYWFDTNQDTAGYGVSDAGTYDWLGTDNWNTSSDGGAGTYSSWVSESGGGLVNDQGAETTFTVKLGAADDQTVNHKGFLGLNWDFATSTALGSGDAVIGGVGGSGTLRTSGGSTAFGTAAGTLTINSAVELSSYSYGMGFRGGTVVINGLVSGSGGVSYSTGDGLSSGTLTLANTGNTYGNRGTSTYLSYNCTLEVTKLANGGSASSIGTSSDNFAITGGTLKFIGTGAQSTDLGFHIGSGGANVDASGPTSADTISFSGAPSYSSANAGRSLILTGSNAGGNTIAFDFGNNGSGVNSLTKNGSGAWVMSGTNSYTGMTIVNLGKLLVNGIHTGGSTYTVANNATLGGSGTLACPITLNNGATLAPGGIAGFGTLTVSNAVTVASGRTFAVKIGDHAQGQFSQLRVGPGVTVTLGGTLTIDDSEGSGAGTITIVNVNELGGTRSGTFSNFPNDGDTYVGTRGTWTLHYGGGAAGSGDVTLTLPPRGTVAIVK